MPKKMPIYRITIDEFLADDLVRILVAELAISSRATLFDDTSAAWKEEQPLVVNPTTWAEKLSLPPGQLKAHPFSSLFEGQVFLYGNVSLNRSKRSTKKFRISKTSARRLLPITSLAQADIKSLYRQALTGGPSS